MTGRQVRAEQALLGAVLADPAGQQDVLDLVRRDDMYRPWHGQVLAAMQRLRGRGVPPGPLEVYDELKRDPDLPRAVSHDAVPLVSLMEAAPRAGHAPAYAAMVIDGGIRQRIWLAGSRMAQAAGDQGADLSSALFAAAQAGRELAACRARWAALPEPVRRELPAAASASQRERHAQRRSARAARPHGPETEAAGIAVLRDLCADPSQLGLVGGWLRPAHFAIAEHGELYAVVRAMHAAGRPVDPVTVSWEATRRGIRADAADLAGRTGVFAWSNARKVHRGAVFAQIAQAGRDIQANAADPSLSPRLLMGAVGDRLRHIERDSRAQPNRQPDADVQATTTTRRPGPACCYQPNRQPGREATR